MGNAAMPVNRDANAEAIVEPASWQAVRSADIDQFPDPVFKTHVATRRPKVSVMLITYNHEKYIAQALESVLMQETEYDYEINVIEDCSTDLTQEIVMKYVEKYPHIVKPYFNVKNIGHEVTQKNTYRGFQTLTGDYFAILEGDDYWTSPHKLQKQIAFLEANPEFAICACNTIKIYEDDNKNPHRFLYYGQKEDATIEEVIRLTFFFHLTGVIFRNVFKGVPPPQFRDKRSCDIFITIAHAQFGKAHHIDEDMAVYRAHRAGRFSVRSKIDEWMFDIDGLRCYNSWLGYRYCKAFCETIVKYCKHVLAEAGREEVAPLTWYQFIKILSLLACYQFISGALGLLRRARNLPRQIALQIKSLITRKKLVFARKTNLFELPKVPDNAHWELIWGLNAKTIEGQEIVDDHPILKLTAVRDKNGEARNRHALCETLSGLDPGRAHKIKLWVKGTPGTNIHIQLRDSNVGDSGRPAHEGEVWFNLSSQTIGRSKGDILKPKIEPNGDGWQRLSADFVTSDGLIYVYLGLVKTSYNSHVFKASGEQVIFGGVEICVSPGPMDLPRQLKYPAVPKPALVPRKPSFSWKLSLPIRGPLSRNTKLAELPKLPESARWELIWGLNAKTIYDRRIVTDQPILRLTAIPSNNPAAQDRHALCQRISGHIPGCANRVKLWVKPLAGANVHIQLRDSNVGDSGKPTHMGEVLFNLFSHTVGIRKGDIVGSGIDPHSNGWLSVWIDFVTSDGVTYVYLGLVSRTTNQNIFKGSGEQVVFGGIEFRPATQAWVSDDVSLAV
jgi:glycosyltransferase involved in cell wall biosynthesis